MESDLPNYSSQSKQFSEIGKKYFIVLGGMDAPGHEQKDIMWTCNDKRFLQLAIVKGKRVNEVLYIS